MRACAGASNKLATVTRGELGGEGPCHEEACGGLGVGSAMGTEKTTRRTPSNSQRAIERPQAKQSKQRGRRRTI